MPCLSRFWKSNKPLGVDMLTKKEKEVFKKLKLDSNKMDEITEDFLESIKTPNPKKEKKKVIENNK